MLFLPEAGCFAGRAKAVEYVAAFLRQKGPATDRLFPTHTHVSGADGKLMDVFVAIAPPPAGSAGPAAPPRPNWIPGPAEGFALDSLFPPRLLSLEGIEIPCPRETELYLRALYGDKWQIADDNFHHFWRSE